MSEDEGDVFLAAEVGEPVPGEDALDADDHIGAVGLDGLQKWSRFGFDVVVQNDFAVAVDDAEVHGVGVQVDATVVLMSFGVKSHWVSSSLGNSLAYPSIPFGYC